MPPADQAFVITCGVAVALGAVQFGRAQRCRLRRGALSQSGGQGKSPTTRRASDFKMPTGAPSPPRPFPVSSSWFSCSVFEGNLGRGVTRGFWRVRSWLTADSSKLAWLSSVDQS